MQAHSVLATSHASCELSKCSGSSRLVTGAWPRSTSSGSTSSWSPTRPSVSFPMTNLIPQDNKANTEAGDMNPDPAVAGARRSFSSSRTTIKLLIPRSSRGTVRTPRQCRALPWPSGRRHEEGNGAWLGSLPRLHPLLRYSLGRCGSRSWRSVLRIRLQRFELDVVWVRYETCKVNILPLT